MKLKRDNTSSNAPAPNQIEIGELAINTNTGILYSKMADGTVIKWLGVPVCESPTQTVCPVPVPKITVGDTTNFCCNGDILNLSISNLLIDHAYTCSISDISTNPTTVIAPTGYNLLPLNKSDRNAIFNLTINKNIQSNASIKIKVFENITTTGGTVTMLRSEKIVNICCNNCGA